MKNLWMFLGALIFVTQAHCLDPDEFMIENATPKILYIKDDHSDVLRVLGVGKKESFKRKPFSKEEKIILTLYFGDERSESKTIEIKYPPTGNIIFKQGMLEFPRNYMGSPS